MMQVPSLMFTLLAFLQLSMPPWLTEVPVVKLSSADSGRFLLPTCEGRGGSGVDIADVDPRDWLDEDGGVGRGGKYQNK